MADFDIGNILSSLSGDDINNLKNMAASILGGTEKENVKENNKESSLPADLGNFDFSNLGFPDMQQFSNLIPLLSALNTHDEREDFITALKPLLSEERRKKADEAVKLIKLMSIIPILREKGIM